MGHEVAVAELALGEDPLGPEVVAAGRCAVVEPLLERRDPVEEGAVRRLRRGARRPPGRAASGSPGAVRRAPAHAAAVLGLAVCDPAGPAAGEAVGLRLGGDRRPRWADPRLHRVAELVRHHEGGMNRPKSSAELGEERPVVGDGVGVGGVGAGSRGVVLGLARPGAAADDAVRVLPRVHVAGVHAEVAARRGAEPLAEDVGEGARVQNVSRSARALRASLSTGSSVAPTILTSPAGTLPGEGRVELGPADDDRRAAGGAEDADERGRRPSVGGPTRFGAWRSGSPQAVPRKPSVGTASDPQLAAARRPRRGTLRRSRRGPQPSCTNQTAPSGGAARVAENGWPCQGSATASTPPRLPTPEPP